MSRTLPNFHQSSTWLITGAAGFIGSNLTEALLRADQEVVALDNFATGHRRNIEDVRQAVGERRASRLRVVTGDVRDPEVCAEVCVGVDYVLHQAALGSVPRSIKDPRPTHEANVEGFFNVLIAARDAEVKRLVYASSSSVYGDHPGLPKVEQEIGTPLSPYAVSKRIDELYARTFQDHYGLECIGLRYFNVFGRRQDPSGAYAAVIPKWIGQLLAGERPVIYGDGETSRDFCYIENVVQANLRAAVAPSSATGAVYNIAYGERTTLNELYRSISVAISSQRPGYAAPEPDYGPFRPGDVRHSLADISAAKEQLGYSPTYSAQEGLLEAIAWYLSTAPLEVEHGSS